MEFETIDTTQMSKSEQQEIGLDLFMGSGGLNETSELLQKGHNGAIETPLEFTSVYHGSSPAAALGRAYKLRDDLRKSGYSCEANLTGTKYILPSTEMYEFTLTIEDK